MVAGGMVLHMASSGVQAREVPILHPAGSLGVEMKVDLPAAPWERGR
jgi:hypothetical protein